MKTHDSAHQAAEQHARLNDEEDKFEEGYIAYADDLIERGVILTRPKRYSSGDNWILIHDGLWYLFTEKGTQLQGPYQTKREVLRYVGEESASYEDTGLYSLSDGRLVARRGVAIEKDFRVNPPAEVTQ